MSKLPDFNDLFQNESFHDWPLYYDPLLPETVPDEDGFLLPTGSGLTILPNGDAEIRVYAPKASEIRYVSGRTCNKKDLLFERGEGGLWTLTIPFDPLYAGPHSLDLIVDGTTWLCPYLPISWHRNRPVNYIDVPDPETPYVLTRSVPHGTLTRELYWSETLGRYQRCVIYTPPGYMKNTESYPVLYLQHGATENEVTWEYNGRVSSIMDNLIADGKARPMLIVMNDGMVALPGKGPGSAFADMLLNDCIPFIEKTYRVRTDRNSRALAGLSMGSMQTSIIGLSHPELFCSLGIFSGFLRSFGRLVSDDHVSNPHLQALKDPKAFVENYRVFFRSVGDLDDLAPRFYEDDQILEEAGITGLPNVYRVIYKNQCHEFGSWRRALYDFVQLIF